MGGGLSHRGVRYGVWGEKSRERKRQPSRLSRPAGPPLHDREDVACRLWLSLDILASVALRQALLTKMQPRLTVWMGVSRDCDVQVSSMSAYVYIDARSTRLIHKIPTFSNYSVRPARSVPLYQQNPARHFTRLTPMPVSFLRARARSALRIDAGAGSRRFGQPGPGPIQ